MASKEIQKQQQIAGEPGAGEAEHAEGGDGGVDAPADHGVGGAVLEEAQALADAVCAGGAGGAAAVVGAAQPLLQGDVAGGEVREDPGGRKPS